MNLVTEKIDGIEITYSKKGDYKNFIIFIPGGGTKIGKSRFNNWQERFSEEKTGSLSIDFPGVGNSEGDITSNTLASRIEITEKFVKWVIDNFRFDNLSLYGSSMGGYVALGVCVSTPEIGELILHVPAAYAEEARDVNFGERFRTILRKKKSWENSSSFIWLEKLDIPILLIEHEDDDVIPKEITEKYLQIGAQNKLFHYYKVANTKHAFSTKEAKEIVFQRARDFIGIDLI